MNKRVLLAVIAAFAALAILAAVVFIVTRKSSGCAGDNSNPLPSTESSTESGDVVEPAVDTTSARLNELEIDPVIDEETDKTTTATDPETDPVVGDETSETTSAPEPETEPVVGDETSEITSAPEPETEPVVDVETTTSLNELEIDPVTNPETVPETEPETEPIHEHDFGELIAGIPATCTENGSKSYYLCLGCGKYFDTDHDEIFNIAISATGHVEVIDQAVTPTCTESGLSEGSHCSVCNTVLVEQTVVPATGHTEVIDQAVAPTCTESGLTEGSHCSVCGEIIAQQSEVDALGHAWGDGVVTKEPTTAEEGTITYTCSRCLENKTEPLPPIFSEGLSFSSKGDGTCNLSGIGSCLDNDVRVPQKSPAGDTVIGVDGSAFKGLGSITRVFLPEGLTTIGHAAFYNCSALCEVSIPDSVTSVQLFAFSECANLPFTEYEGALYLGNKSNAHLVAMQATSNEIKSCRIHDDTKVIARGAFTNCHDLSDLTIGENVTVIGEEAFHSCYALTRLTIPDSVKSIESAAFRYCGLAHVTLGKNVSYIYNFAFANCGRLFEVKNRSSFNLTAGNSNLGFIAYYAKRIYTEGESYVLDTDDGFVFYDDGSKYYLLKYTGDEAEISLPEKYKGKTYEIGGSAFYHCGNLTGVTIPATVSVIGAEAFRYSGLTTVTIPKNVKSIGNCAFQNCDNLTTLIWNATGCQTTGSWSNEVFRNCPNLKTIIIGENVTKLPANAFARCSELTDIFFLGTEDEWNAITKLDSWDANTGDYVLHFGGEE